MPVIPVKAFGGDGNAVSLLFGFDRTIVEEDKWKEAEHAAG